jgi:predicted  nucleic acid-binding Zn-ribbon protein
MFALHYAFLSPFVMVCYYPLTVIEYSVAISRQLYQLQELDTTIELDEQSLSLKTGRLGKREVLDAAQARFNLEQNKLKELNHQRRDAEGELDDILSKITAAEQQLYGGKITNPKELANLQHEVNTLKSRSDQLETRALEVIDQVEEAEKNATSLNNDYQRLEDEWRLQQKQLTEEVEQLKSSLADLKQKRQQAIEQIDTSAVALYEKIRQQKKPAVAKVEQGICRACRISLSASTLQKARGGQPVQCGTCGRILFIS